MWKNLPSWIKGGMIGILIFLIILIIFTFLFYRAESKLLPESRGHSDYTYTSLILAPALLPGYVFTVIIGLDSLINKDGFISYIMTSIFTCLIYLLIGVFVGWVVGKIKSKKQVI